MGVNLEYLATGKIHYLVVMWSSVPQCAIVRVLVYGFRNVWLSDCSDSLTIRFSRRVARYSRI